MKAISHGKCGLHLLTLRHNKPVIASFLTFTYAISHKYFSSLSLIDKEKKYGVHVKFYSFWILTSHSPNNIANTFLLCHIGTPIVDNNVLMR